VLVIIRPIIAMAPLRVSCRSPPLVRALSSFFVRKLTRDVTLAAITVWIGGWRPLKFHNLAYLIFAKLLM
jgi:hypothetical protein